MGNIWSFRIMWVPLMFNSSAEFSFLIISFTELLESPGLNGYSTIWISGSAACRISWASRVLNGWFFLNFEGFKLRLRSTMYVFMLSCRVLLCTHGLSTTKSYLFTETSDRGPRDVASKPGGYSPGIDDRRESRTWSETKAFKPLILSSCREMQHRVGDDLPSHMISSLDGNH